MKQEKTQQEIVLLTATIFFKRQWYKTEIANTNYKACTEQLEEACWNGLLSEILPEVMKRSACGTRLFLWHLRRGTSFLKIELGELPPQLEEHYSIDAAFFLPVMVYN